MSRFKNFFNEITNDGRIFSFEDVINIPREEDEFYSKALDFQYGKIGFPREKELQDSMNVSKVEPFTYDDGSVTRAGFRSNDGAQFVDYSKPFMTTPSMEKSRIDKKVDDIFGGNSTGVGTPVSSKPKQIEPFQGGIKHDENLGVKNSSGVNNYSVQALDKSAAVAQDEPWKPAPLLLKAGVEEVNYLGTPLYNDKEGVKYDPAQVYHDSQASTVTGYEYKGQPISAEQAKEIERIQKEFAGERAQIEKDRILGHAQDWGGFALQVGSALVPGMGAANLTKAIASKLAPKVGKKIAKEIATGMVHGGVSGSMFGAGDAMLEDKNVLGGAVAGGLSGVAGGAATGKVAGEIDRLIDGSKLKKHIPFDEMSKEDIGKYNKLGKGYYKNYLQGTTLRKDGFGDIYFGRESAGKNKAHAMELYPELKNQLKTAKIGEISNDKGEADRYYQHLINTYGDKVVDYIIEVVNRQNNYKMSKYLQ